MDIRLNVETMNLNLALKEMQRRLSGRVAPARIVEYEVGKILESALAKTDRATKASIQASDNKRKFRKYDFGKGMKSYYLENRYPDALWARIEDKLAQSLARKLGEIGLSKRLLAETAAKLGIKIQAPGYVAAAHPFHSQDTAVKKSASDAQFIIEINLNSPLLSKHSSLPKALFSAIVGRRKNIEQSAARGTFNELSAVAKQFPGLIVTKG